MELLRLEDVTFAYPGRPPVHQGLNFTLNKGDRLGIWGPNGAGKSTMFLLAMGLVAPSQGRIHGLGQLCQSEKDFRRLRRQVGLLFQDPDDQLFCPTVAEDVAFGPRNLGLGKDEALRVVDRTLADLGLEGYQKRVTYQLSGGEKRLVSLAAVLAMEPQAILLDEPSNGLDEEHSVRLERRLLDSPLSWAIVSHDRGFLQRLCQRILVMQDGALVEQ
ncbi:energy-coupling factor ABC transporter ATP-binding protein [Desulfarculus baarsii]